MKHTPTRALAWASAWALCGCGNRVIELRETAARVDEPVPRALEAESSAPDSPAEPMAGLGRDDQGVTPSPVESALPGEQSPTRPELQPLPTSLDEGCGKIDFLFVVDDSESMEDEQANLARSFAGFIGVIGQVLEASDFHIMVVGTGGDEQREDEPALDPAQCEEIRGAGRRLSANGVDCGITGGLPFMTSQQPDLEATFSCLALVGTDGAAFERPMDAMFAATGAALDAPGRCNDGFLRDDAVLVVTVITDEDDRRSEGEPEEWRRVLLDLKGGKDDALVVLGLVGDNNVDGGLLGGPCSGTDADGATRLQELVSSVDGVLGSVCASDYTPFFQTAVGSIDSACSDFETPRTP